ncbi:MAG: hypothetical protein HY782_27545, partial [Chloroflexi bacterium]|nr:hypothetical protein [Chloroflexota bacterium]
MRLSDAAVKTFETTRNLQLKTGEPALPIMKQDGAAPVRDTSPDNQSAPDSIPDARPSQAPLFENELAPSFRDQSELHAASGLVQKAPMAAEPSSIGDSTDTRAEAWIAPESAARVEPPKAVRSARGTLEKSSEIDPLPQSQFAKPLGDGHRRESQASEANTIERSSQGDERNSMRAASPTRASVQPASTAPALPMVAEKAAGAVSPHLAREVNLARELNDRAKQDFSPRPDNQPFEWSETNSVRARLPEHQNVVARRQVPWMVQLHKEPAESQVSGFKDVDAEASTWDREAQSSPSPSSRLEP